MSREQRRSEPFLAFAQLFHPRARFVLPLAPLESRPCYADEGPRMERSFEKGDVSEQIRNPRHAGVALAPAAASGQDDEGDIRPFGLSAQARRDSAQVGRA